MTAKWPEVALGDVLYRVKDEVLIDDTTEYVRLTIRMNGKGIVPRDKVIGAQIGTKRQFIAKAGQLVLSKIDARNGAFGILPPACSNSIITGNFWAFDVNQALLDATYFEWLTRTSLFVDFCRQASEGTTNRRYLQEDSFLHRKIPLPPLAEQRRIAGKIELLASNIGVARRLSSESQAEAEILSKAILSRTFHFQQQSQLPAGWIWQTLAELLEDTANAMSTGPFGTLLQVSDLTESGVPVLGIGNVAENKFLPPFRQFVSHQKADDLFTYQLRAGDIVIARSGTVGRSCVVPDGLVPAPLMSTNLVRVRLNAQQFRPHLLCRLFNGSTLVEQHKQDECRGTSRDFFTQKILRKLVVPVPPLAVQEDILARVEAHEALTERMLREALSADYELDALLTSILDRAFKGAL